MSWFAKLASFALYALVTVTILLVCSYVLIQVGIRLGWFRSRHGGGGEPQQTRKKAEVDTSGAV